MHHHVNVPFVLSAWELCRALDRFSGLSYHMTGLLCNVQGMDSYFVVLFNCQRERAATCSFSESINFFRVEMIKKMMDSASSLLH